MTWSKGQQTDVNTTNSTGRDIEGPLIEKSRRVQMKVTGRGNDSSLGTVRGANWQEEMMRETSRRVHETVTGAPSD